MIDETTPLTRFRLYLQMRLDSVETPLKIATSEAELDRVHDLIKKTYLISFPGLKIADNDVFIRQGVNFFTEDDNGVITGSISLSPDSSVGLPDEKYLSECIANIRRKRFTIYQVGRFVVAKDKDSVKTALSLLQCLYLFQMIIPNSLIVGLVKQKDVKLHTCHFGAQELASGITPDYASDITFSAVLWDKEALSGSYFSKTGCPREIESVYSNIGELA